MTDTVDKYLLMAMLNGDGGHEYGNGGLEYGNARRRRRARVPWRARWRRRVFIYVTREGIERVISSTAMTSSNSYDKIRASGPACKKQNLWPKKA
jgi:hypothetical protein